MNLTTMEVMTDPLFMARWIQENVDSLTGRHIDLVFIKIAADAINSIDITSIVNDANA